MAAPTLSSAEIIDNSATGTAQAGAAASITVASGQVTFTDRFKGCLAHLTGGRGEGNFRYVGSCDAGTDVCDVSPDWDSEDDPNTALQPDGTTTYEIFSGRTLKLTWSESVTYQGESEATIASDTFTDTSGTVLSSHTPDTDTEGGGWITEDGISGQSAGFGLKVGASNSCEALANSNPNFGIIDGGLNDNFTTGADLAHGGLSFNPLSIIFRSNSDMSEWMEIEFHDNNDTVKLFKDGSEVDSVSVDPVIGGNTFKVTVQGSSITVTRDGSALATFSDSSYNDASHQYCGLELQRTSGHTADNFFINSLVAAKQITVNGQPLVFHTNNRQMLIEAIEHGDGTTTTYHTLPPGKPIVVGETVTVDIEAEAFKNGASEGNAVISGTSVTNNSQFSSKPQCSLFVPRHLIVTDGSLEWEGQAYGFIGNSDDGITQYQISADDGTNPATTQAKTTRSASVHDGLRLYAGSLDISGLDDGRVTLTGTATGSAGGETGDSRTVEIVNDSGGTLSKATYYCATTGNDSTGDGSEGNPFRTPRGVAEAAQIAGNDYAICILNDAGNFQLSGASIAAAFTGILWIQLGSGLTKSDCHLTHAAGTISYMSSSGGILIDGSTWTLNKSADGSATPQPFAHTLGYGNITMISGEFTTGTSISRDYTGGDFTNPFSISLATGANNTLQLFHCEAPQVTTFRGFKKLRNVTGNETDGDFFDGAEVCGVRGPSSTQHIRRGSGHAAFSVVCTEGNPTIAKSGSTLTLVDDTNGTTNFDLSTASYDTLSELVAAITAVTGWTASRTGFDTDDSSWDAHPTDGDGTDSPGINVFAAVNASTSRTIYFRTALHTDLIHSFSGVAAEENRIYECAASVTVPSATQPGGGGDAGVQSHNFESAGSDYFIRKRTVVINCIDVQWTSNNGPQTPRSMFKCPTHNFLWGFNTSVYRSSNLDYNGDGIGAISLNRRFQPTNWIAAHNVIGRLSAEGDPLLGDDAGTDIIASDNHYVSTSAGSVDAQDSAATSGSLAGEFTDFDPDTPDWDGVDLTPADGSTMVSRLDSGLTLNGFGDFAGTLVPEDGTGAIGALQEASAGGGGADAARRSLLMRYLHQQA